MLRVFGPYFITTVQRTRKCATKNARKERTHGVHISVQKRPKKKTLMYMIISPCQVMYYRQLNQFMKICRKINYCKDVLEVSHKITLSTKNVWKVIPKNLSASFKTVSIRAYIATCVCNKDTCGLLALLNGSRINCGPNAHKYVTQHQDRIKITNLRARHNTREGRMLRRRQKTASAEAANEAEGSLYGSGIDDSM